MSALSSLSPEKLYARLSAAFYSVVRDRRLWIILIAAVPASLLIYGTFSIYQASAADSVVEGLSYYSAADWASACGRFLTRYASSLTGNLVTPVLALMEGILFLCLSAYCIVRMWDIQKPVWIVLTCLLLLGNPSIVFLSFLPHIFAIYCLAILLAILYVFCITHFDRLLSVFIGAAFLTCSLGIYQSYIGVAAAGAVGSLLLALIDGRSFKYIRRLFMRFFLSGFSGGVLYLALMKIDLAVHQIDAADRVSNVSLSDVLFSLPQQIFLAYKTFFSYFLDSTLDRRLFYVCLFALFFLIFLLWTQSFLSKREYWRCLCFIILILLFPLTANVITIIITFQAPSILTFCSMNLIFPLAFAIIQRTKAGVWFSWTKLGCVVLSVVIFWTYVITSNATATAYNLCYRYCYFETSEMLSDVYDLPDYQDGDRIILAGFRNNYDDLRKALPKLFDYAVSMPGTPVFWEDMNGIMNSRKGYLLNYFGIDAGDVSYDEYTALVTSEEFESMPLWPSEGSVAKINGIVVVKISEDPPVP